LRIEISALADEREFQRFMEQIDAQLRRRGVPVRARQLQAVGEASKLVNARLIMGPALPPGASEQDRQGYEFAARVMDWMEARYGDKLKVDMSIGAAPLILRDDAWLMRLPYIVGSVAVVYDCNLSTNYPDMSGPAMPRGRATLNVLTLIEGLSSDLARGLSLQEIHEIAKCFGPSMTTFSLLDEVKVGKPLISAAQFDLRRAAEICVCDAHQLGFSRWHSLQAAEKVIKAYIESRGTSFPHNHDLAGLASIAEKNGASPIPSELLKQAQCPASVRYEPEKSTISETVAAHRAAVEICGAVTFSIKQNGPNRIIM